MKTTTCVYRRGPVDLGRSRTRCPACGAELQSTRPQDGHYIEPRAPRTATPDLPPVLGEPEPIQ